MLLNLELSNLTYSKLNRDREEVDAGSLGDSLTAGNTRQVDVAGLNEALLALGSAKHLFSESKESVSVCDWDMYEKASYRKPA